MSSPCFPCSPTLNGTAPGGSPSSSPVNQDCDRSCACPISRHWPRESPSASRCGALTETPPAATSSTASRSQGSNGPCSPAQPRKLFSRPPKESCAESIPWPIMPWPPQPSLEPSSSSPSTSCKPPRSCAHERTGTDPRLPEDPDPRLPVRPQARRSLCPRADRGL